LNIYQTGDYLKKNQTWHSEDAPWKAARIGQILRKNEIAFSTAVEVGCGTGQILVEMSRMFPATSFSGYDISTDAATFWHDMPGTVRLRKTDFLETSDQFDLLLLIDVVEHVRDYMGFLEALRPRAKFHVFHIPLELSAQGVLRDVPMQTRNLVGHLHYFSKTTALATLKDCGYRLVDFQYADAALDRAPSKKARLLNILRRPLFALAPELTARILGGRSLVVLTARD
jgi:hypothetical protein